MKALLIFTIAWLDLMGEVQVKLTVYEVDSQQRCHDLAPDLAAYETNQVILQAGSDVKLTWNCMAQDTAT